MTLGQRLRAYREKEGLTQEQFAEYLNVSRQAVTKWEHDKGVPDIDNLVALSRKLGVTLDALVLGPEPEKSAPFAPSSVPSDSLAPCDGLTPRDGLTPLNAPALPAAERSTPSERARYHAFAALAFVFAAFCQAVAGCVNLAAVFRRSVPAFLPILSFCSAILLLYVAYAQAAACSRYRRKTTYDPYCQE